MVTLIGIGFSKNPDPEQAFKEAAIDVKNQINAPTVGLALTLFTSGYASPIATEPIQRILQPKRLVGAMAPALIVKDHAEPKGVAILGIASDEMEFGSQLIENVSLMNSREAGFKVAREAASDISTPYRQCFLALSNSISANHSPLLLGMQEAIGLAFPFSGGIVCDDQLNRAVLLHNNVRSTDGILGILIGGPAQPAVSARHGWKPLGKPRIIDFAEKNLIKVIDGKPAISIYQDYFSEELKSLERNNLGNIGLLYPLGLNTDRPKEYLIRHPIEILPDGSIVCQAEIPSGSRVHLMISDKDSCYQSAQAAANEIRDRLSGRPPKLLIILESWARRKLLGRAVSQELNLIKEIFGLTVPIFGMYTYGEIAPLGTAQERRTSEILNANIVITAIA